MLRACSITKASEEPKRSQTQALQENTPVLLEQERYLCSTYDFLLTRHFPFKHEMGFMKAQIQAAVFIHEISSDRGNFKRSE